ncbi:MAG: hypothetical protein IBX55_21445 [Methyloprofundus sp.]|nr:hypothetical protein [Methyloprofundus sp.]
MLSKNIIDKQVNKLASEFFADQFNGSSDDKCRALSKAYTQLTMKNMLDLDEDEAFDCVVDGKNDFAIDGLYFSEPQNEFFDIYIYQIKRFIANPLSFMIYIAEKQIWNFLCMLALFVMILGGLFMSNDAVEAIRMISIAYCLYYVLHLILSFKLAVTK